MLLQRDQGSPISMTSLYEQDPPLANRNIVSGKKKAGKARSPGHNPSTVQLNVDVEVASTTTANNNAGSSLAASLQVNQRRSAAVPTTRSTRSSTKRNA
ncbi:hypothetical protein CPC08DRAFT_717860 [Agrocybe pediades]|nr:hypothetical protein CPC08DRAFT_717860 [Agrocybe pediades]